MATRISLMNFSGDDDFVATRNACKLCSPLGASVVFRGIEGAAPFLHGSQGCATYIRRYVISHFREPIDIASSNFSEHSAIFGGGQNLTTGISNVTRQYQPSLIGVATTCLSETIGDDVPMLLAQYRKANEAEAAKLPALVNVSTPSYSGTHMDGFHAAVRAVADQLAEGGEKSEHVNLLPGFVSCADLRHLKEIVSDFGLEQVLLPDYSDTLDGPAWSEYQNIPAGGTTVGAIRTMGRAAATIQCGRTLAMDQSAGDVIQKKHNVPCHKIGLPIGVRETDAMFDALRQISGRPTPAKYEAERGRLIDAYVDGHKYVFGKRAVVYGEEDLVVGLVSMLGEIGVIPVLVASGGESGRLVEAIRSVWPTAPESLAIRQGADFVEISQEAEALKPDLIIGNSKGQSLSRKLNIPHIRVGFPIHDRFGGHRVLHVGYRGAQQLFDGIVNAILEKKQRDSEIGYAYM